MTRLMFYTFIACIGLNAAQIASAGDQPQYESLQEFCVATKKDTPENCECGQATADRIMSAEEQAAALAMMTGNTDVLIQLGDRRAEFMAKLSQVTAGCT